ncbi:unnamed protein product, partial [Ceratitis capitata]
RNEDDTSSQKQIPAMLHDQFEVHKIGQKTRRTQRAWLGANTPYALHLLLGFLENGSLFYWKLILCKILKQKCEKEMTL